MVNFHSFPPSSVLILSSFSSFIYFILHFQLFILLADSLSFHTPLLFPFYTSFSLYTLISSATNRLITPKDTASVQLNIGEVDAEGRYTGKSVAFALSGAVRFSSEADNSMCRLATEQGLLKSVFSAQH